MAWLRFASQLFSQPRDAGPSRSRRVLYHALFWAAVLVAASQQAIAQTALAAARATASRAPQAGNEIDLFMERVLDNRDASWRRVGDFLLRETETFEIKAPLGIPLSGFRHEYEWYVRDGMVVRSPVRFDGVEIDAETRREYEENWLREERRRRRNGRRRVVSRRGTEDNLAIAIKRSWAAEVSEPLMARIAADANLIGDGQAAITLNTGAILEELGGVEVVGFWEAVAHARDLFVMLDTDRLTATEVGRALRRPLASLVDRIDLAEADELERFVELAELGEQFDLDARDVASYLDRAARVLEDLGRYSVAVRLDDVRGGLVARTEETETVGNATDTDEAVLLDPARLEPRFISESYFMEFTFEPGNYYLEGRETLAGREVVKIEYYPTDLFDDGSDPDDSELKARINRGLNKTTLVTLWIDPEAYQIVKYTFDNTGLDFLPGRWLVRVDDLQASMEMGQPLGDVWLPIRVTVSGRITMALGDFEVMFTREFSDYREAETSGRLIDAGSPR